jgi:hypothetical protein
VGSEPSEELNRNRDNSRVLSTGEAALRPFTPF